MAKKSNNTNHSSSNFDRIDQRMNRAKRSSLRKERQKQQHSFVDEEEMLMVDSFQYMKNVSKKDLLDLYDIEN